MQLTETDTPLPEREKEREGERRKIFFFFFQCVILFKRRERTREKDNGVFQPYQRLNACRDTHTEKAQDLPGLSLSTVHLKSLLSELACMWVGCDYRQFSALVRAVPLRERKPSKRNARLTEAPQEGDVHDVCMVGRHTKTFGAPSCPSLRHAILLPVHSPRQSTASNLSILLGASPHTAALHPLEIENRPKLVSSSSSPSLLFSRIEVRLSERSFLAEDTSEERLGNR